MKPVFWKLSHGSNFFTFQDLLKSIEDRLVYVHNETGKKGNHRQRKPQIRHSINWRLFLPYPWQ